MGERRWGGVKKEEGAEGGSCSGVGRGGGRGVGWRRRKGGRGRRRQGGCRGLKQGLRGQRGERREVQDRGRGRQAGCRGRRTSMLMAMPTGGGRQGRKPRGESTAAGRGAPGRKRGGRGGSVPAWTTWRRRCAARCRIRWPCAPRRQILRYRCHSTTIRASRGTAHVQHIGSRAARLQSGAAACQEGQPQPVCCAAAAAGPRAGPAYPPPHTKNPAHKPPPQRWPPPTQPRHPAHRRHPQPRPHHHRPAARRAKHLPKP